ncbi:hypothetical protein Tco_1369612 [Tanacetum coccineum]
MTLSEFRCSDQHHEGVECSSTGRMLKTYDRDRARLITLWKSFHSIVRFATMNMQAIFWLWTVCDGGLDSCMSDSIPVTSQLPLRYGGSTHRNVGEPSKDKNGRDDNKRTRTGNAFASTTNLVGRENTGTWPKCTTCNSYHAPEGPCRICFNYNRLGHLAKDCRGMPRNVNSVNARNPTVRARGRAFMLGAEEARQDPNIVTVRIPLPDSKVLRVLGERLEEKARLLMSAKASDKKQEDIVMVRDFPDVFLDDLSGLPPL